MGQPSLMVPPLNFLHVSIVVMKDVRLADLENEALCLSIEQSSVPEIAYCPTNVHKH